MAWTVSPCDVRAAASGAAPNAPKSTFVKERFIARLMMIERMKPEAPSSAPAMTRTLLPMANPVGAGDVRAVPEPPVLGHPHERRRDRPEHVRDGDPLGHRRHRDVDAERISDHRSEREAGEDPLEAHDLLLQEGAHDRDEHPDRRELHAPPGPVGDREAAQAQDEEEGRREVGGLDEHRPGSHRLAPPGRPPRRNILSMRSVMMNPPTTLMVAQVTATNPRIV